jgi:anti-anti-sigma factor
MLRGELDEVTAPVLDEAISSNAGELPLIVDLSGLDFIASAGMHVLLRRRPNQPAIVCPPGNIARVLGIASRDQNDRIFDDLEAARCSVSGQARGLGLPLATSAT